MSHRCHVCERTNDKYLALNPENYYHGRYLADDMFPGNLICEECFEFVNETLYDLEQDDEDVKPERI